MRSYSLRSFYLFRIFRCENVSAIGIPVCRPWICISLAFLERFTLCRRQQQSIASFRFSAQSVPSAICRRSPSICLHYFFDLRSNWFHDTLRHRMHSPRCTVHKSKWQTMCKCSKVDTRDMTRHGRGCVVCAQIEWNATERQEIINLCRCRCIRHHNNNHKTNIMDANEQYDHVSMMQSTAHRTMMCGARHTPWC